MTMKDWLDVIGPFGALVVFIIYMILRDRKRVDPVALQNGDRESHHWQGKMLLGISGTAETLAKTQAVQTQILANMQASLDRIERKVETK